MNSPMTSLALVSSLLLSPFSVPQSSAGNTGAVERGMAPLEKRERPAMGIQDNSFLIEEAYNQEAGVVQHILNITRSVDKMRGADDREWAFNFTQEWPVFSQTHQFSYTIPYSNVKSGGQSENGIGDVLLNYRFQALMETDQSPAFAPRISFILPTGDEEKGFGDDTFGYQINLPVSKVLNDRWTVHLNAGATLLPDVNGRDLVGYNLGASAIYAVTPNFNLMLEAVANWDEEADEIGRKDRSFSAIVSPGFRYAFNHANDAQTVVGIAAPIGLTRDAPDYGVIVYVSFEHFFIRPQTRDGSGK